MNPARVLLLALLCSAPLLASAQWQWLDKDGRKVFSDQAPPPDIPANRILRKPGMRAGATLPVEAGAPVAANTPAAGASNPLRPSGKDKALEDKRKQAEAADAEKKKAEEAKIAALRADNCERARQSKMTLDSGQRIALTNAKGEREFMTDEQRAAETKRMADIITRDCRKDRQ